MSFIKEFQQFISKGNVIDIAVGVIIGAAFGKISTSLVGDIIMPPLGLIINNVNFSDHSYTLLNAVMVDGVVQKPAVVIKYGAFIQTILEFLIIAFAVFMMVKVFSKLRKKEDAKPVAAPAKSSEILVLEEIRDLLKKNEEKINKPA